MTEHLHDSHMYTTAGVALGVMVASFIAISVVGKLTKQKIPLAVNLFVCMIFGALATGFGFPLRNLFEGPVWYIYINLVIFSGMIFLNCMRHAGQLNCIAWDILTKFRNQPSIMLVLIMALLFFPGMVTGVGTAAVLSTGMVAVTILRVVGIPRVKIGAIIAMLTTIGAAAPPVNLPAIIIASGINMPYEGFTNILWVLTIPTGLFAVFYLGYRDFKKPTLEHIAASMEKPERKSLLAPYMPLLVVIIIFVLIRAFPGKFPDLITPMVFMLGSLVTLFTGKKFSYVQASKEAVSGGIFSTVALIFVVGTVVQVTTMTGAKGLLVLGALTIGTTAPALMYLALAVSLPLLGGVLTHLGASVILGIPFTLALLTQNVIVVVASISMLCVLAQVIPPSALGGYFAQELVGEPHYSSVLKKCLVPIAVCIALSLVALAFANKFAAVFVPF